MKKKEVFTRLNKIFGGLIIFVLAILVTAGSWFYCHQAPEFVFVGNGRDIVQDIACGLPLDYKRWNYYSKELKLYSSSLILDLLFWFLILAEGWWVLKFAFLKTKMKK